MYITASLVESLFTLSQLRILAAHAVHEYRDIYPREGQFSLDTRLKNIKREEDEEKVRHLYGNNYSDQLQLVKII